MMDSFGLDQLFSIISQLVWPLLALVIAVAGYLLFAAERKHYHLAIGIGGTIQLLLGIAQFLAFSSAFRMEEYDGDAMQKFFRITSLIGMVGHGLIAYGILCVGLVKYKNRANTETY